MKRSREEEETGMRCEREGEGVGCKEGGWPCCCRRVLRESNNKRSRRDKVVCCRGGDTKGEREKRHDDG
jgi:hypothetical protein